VTGAGSGIGRAAALALARAGAAVVVAEAVLRLITDDSLNGRSYQIVPGREDEIL